MYQSNWAREMENELVNVAEKLGEQRKSSKRMERQDKQYDWNQQQEEEVVECWEELEAIPPVIRQEEDHRPAFLRQPPPPPTHKQKVRKPVKITTWFGEETSTDKSESDEGEQWKEIDRKKKNSDRRRRMKRRRKEKEVKCATKAGHMIGLGPITMDQVMRHMDNGMEFEKAKVRALEDFLMDYLGYIEEEIKVLGVLETKFAKGEDILYVALDKLEQVKEIHICKAECRNDDVTTRCYIPPNFYDRFMALKGICMVQRAGNPLLKTQLRFGKSDIEVYTKYKGESTGYRLVKLEEFTDVSRLPTFDHQIKWRIVPDRQPRRKVIYKDMTSRPAHAKARQGTSSSGNPATGLSAREQPAPQSELSSNNGTLSGLIRANSNSTTGTMKKVRRSHTPPSSKLPSSSSSSSSEEKKIKRRKKSQKHKKSKKSSENSNKKYKTLKNEKKTKSCCMQSQIGLPPYTSPD